MYPDETLFKGECGKRIRTSRREKSSDLAECCTTITDGIEIEGGKKSKDTSEIDIDTCVICYRHQSIAVAGLTVPILCESLCVLCLQLLQPSKRIRRVNDSLNNSQIVTVTLKVGQTFRVERDSNFLRFGCFYAAQNLWLGRGECKEILVSAHQLQQLRRSNRIKEWALMFFIDFCFLSLLR